MPRDGRIVAVLGPTNTGKTHLAVERMLGHPSGMIGLPLRLLAREIYDRVVAQRGQRNVALITGEEKIVPPHPHYYVCTVESMPLERSVDFMAVDEIQLCADAERGHVFTDRLLRARGERETMFLGAETMRPIIRRLLPDAEYISRPRFSQLSYAGERKLSRLPRRSAVVAFSAADVYALAELMRRQRGGAAVVLGALSPRTRNAQVALYQSGEVDYLVATDAIGMGLNMDVDHVAFAGLRKFDGLHMRRLSAAEIGQIAGRAGRHMNDGTFGLTAGAGALDPELIEDIVNHRFEAVRQLHWRNSNLGFRSLPALIHSLAMPAPRDELIRARDADDVLALKRLAADGEVADAAAGPAAVKQLWQVCQIPDFRKTMADAHHRLLGRIYLYLMRPAGVLPTDWIAEQVRRLDSTEGDIDTLANRIAHVRTWTYVTNRADWVADAAHWRERTRALEDRLSDALHAALTARFVDRRTAALFRRLREKQELFGAVTADGDVLVEGQYVGKLRGLRFTADAALHGAEGRAVRTAANRVLAREIVKQASHCAEADHGDVAWKDDNRLWWRGAPVARLVAGPHPLTPRVDLLSTEHVSGPLRERVRRRFNDWLEAELIRVCPQLVRLRDADLSGPARGLAFQVTEGLGVVTRETVQPLIDTLTPDDRKALKNLGLRLGFVDVFLPALVKPERQAARSRLWAAHRGLDATLPPPPGLVSLVADPELDPGFYAACGYRLIGGLAVRVDMADRLAVAAREASRAGPFAPDHAMHSLLGRGREDLHKVLLALGYRAQTKDETTRYRFAGRPGRARRKQAATRRARAHSPFAALGRLNGGD